jgi:NTP pyrophosphatase (non-canonical NTP hydrolase)
MKLNNDFSLIRDWAEKKGIYEKGDVKTQSLKLFEEAGELAKSLMNNDKDEFIDALGDITIVLVSVAKLGSIHFKEDITLERCIDSAYNVIVNRKGKMENGTFIKENNGKKIN